MLTKGDLIKALKDFRKDIREEIEFEGKLTRKEFSFSFIRLESRLIKVEDRLKDVEIQSQRFEKELKKVREDIAIVNLKVEAFNNKLDVNNKDISGVFQRVLNTVDELNDKIERRVAKLEKHVGLSPAR